MNTKDIKDKINKSFNNSIPDNFDNILLNCKKKEGKEKMKKIEKEGTIKKAKNKFIPKLSFALALILLLTGVTYFSYSKFYQVDSIVQLDVNPSIELKVSKDEKVLDAVAKNNDAKEVLEDMDLENVDIDVALNAIIGSLVTKGYIDDLSNSILISVENKDHEKGEQLRQKLSEKISSILGNDKINGSVLSQTLDKDKKAEDLANKYGISLGKAKLILDVLDSNSLLKETDLVDLSINELNVLSESNKTNLKDIQKEGTASTKSYIGKTKAKEIALNHAKVSNPRNLEVDFDADDGKIVYEVEFDTSKYEYDYEINAKTGAIIHSHKEKSDNYSNDIDDYDDNDDYDYDDDDYDDDNYNNKVNSNKNTSTNSTSSYISSSRAKEIALSHAGVGSPRNVHVELDREDNEYSVEFTANGKEYDYEINAKTGRIIDYDVERIDND